MVTEKVLEAGGAASVQFTAVPEVSLGEVMLTPFGTITCAWKRGLRPGLGFGVGVGLAPFLVGVGVGFLPEAVATAVPTGAVPCAVAAAVATGAAGPMELAVGALVPPL
jgi:hypothetical protein